MRDISTANIWGARLSCLLDPIDAASSLRTVNQIARRVRGSSSMGSGLSSRRTSRPPDPRRCGPGVTCGHQTTCSRASTAEGRTVALVYRGRLLGPIHREPRSNEGAPRLRGRSPSPHRDHRGCVSGRPVEGTPNHAGSEPAAEVLVVSRGRGFVRQSLTCRLFPGKAP